MDCITAALPRHAPQYDSALSRSYLHRNFIVEDRPVLPSRFDVNFPGALLFGANELVLVLVDKNTLRYTKKLIVIGRAKPGRVTLAPAALPFRRTGTTGA